MGPLVSFWVRNVSCWIVLHVSTFARHKGGEARIGVGTDRAMLFRFGLCLLKAPRLNRWDREAGHLGGKPNSIALENDTADQAFDSGHLDKCEEPGILAW